jgi:hypothetical protein
MVETYDLPGAVEPQRSREVCPFRRLKTGLVTFMFANKEPYYYIILIMLISGADR